MSLLDELREKDGALTSVGESIRADAKKKDTSFSYIDPVEPDIIVIETGDEMIRKPLPLPERWERR